MIQPNLTVLSGLASQKTPIQPGFSARHPMTAPRPTLTQDTVQFSGSSRSGLASGAAGSMQDVLHFSGSSRAKRRQREAADGQRFSGQPARGPQGQGFVKNQPTDPAELAAIETRNRRELSKMLEILPEATKKALRQLSQEEQDKLQAVFIEYGKVPEVAFYAEEGQRRLDAPAITQDDLDRMEAYFTERDDNAFDDVSKNRAGIEGTLHRVSAKKNHRGEIDGFTLRRGKEPGLNLGQLENIFKSGKNVLVLGKPGFGKTSLLRATAKKLSLADEDKSPPWPGKRTVIVDRSREIAGDSATPHVSIGNSTQMQVPFNRRQDQVMIEAVENQEPKTVIVDEIGTKEEVDAALTIAERGVQLIGTAHGSTFESLVNNPVINPLIGGIESVTMGDVAASQRLGKTGGILQKEVRQQKGESAFDYVLVFEDRGKIAVYGNINETVRRFLDGQAIEPILRVEI